ncbi:MAG: hypothetical protein WCX48_04670 [Bacteroidales bacterium]
METKIKEFMPKTVLAMILTCVISSFLIEIPKIFSVDLKSFSFYEKNAALIVFFGLSVFSLWLNSAFSNRKLIYLLLAFTLPAIYVNLLPSGDDSSSINLVYIHLPLLLWAIYGVVFINFDMRDKAGRIGYIRYNGDLAVVTGLILIAGAILAGVTISLFEVLDLKIEKFYMDYIALCGLVSAPVVAAFIIDTYPMASSKIVPIIAHIFSPLVLFTLVIYLIAIPFSGKDPYNDRDFLLIFNLMLIGVMAIVVFSVSETITGKRNRFNESVLMLLAFVTLVIDLIALSAILYRLGEFGISPNRIAVLGSNILIFANLALILVDLFRVNFKKSAINIVENTISRYLPVYLVWILIVVFAFPLIFGMK